MDIDSKNIVNLDLKREHKNLNFNDFQKQPFSFDVIKLQKNLMMVGGYLTLEQFV
jgi:hypothetical protein